MIDFALEKTYEFKEEEDAMLITMLSPILLYIIAEMNIWAILNDVPWKYNRSVASKIKGVSISATHQEGRAADFSTQGWSKEKIKKFCDHFNKKYSEEGTSETGENPKVAVYHNAGLGFHLHIQIRRGISLKEFQDKYFR